jgi:hypothetical protein
MSKAYSVQDDRGIRRLNKSYILLKVINLFLLLDHINGYELLKSGNYPKESGFDIGEKCTFIKSSRSTICINCK